MRINKFFIQHFANKAFSRQMSFLLREQKFTAFSFDSKHDINEHFLADRTAARSMIGYWHHTVVCLSVRLWRCAL